MADVASRAGVSHQTVSRVVNGSPSVSPQTRARVLEAIEALAYRPNRLARALVTQRSGLIGVCVARLGYYGPSSMVTAIDEAAREAGYGLQLMTLPEVTGANVQVAMELLVSEGAEALAVITPERLGVSETGSNITVPVVMLNATPALTVTTVGVDQVLGTRMAIDHLISLGHSRIAHIAGPDGWAEAEMRQATWTQTLRAASLPPGARFVGDWSAASGYQLARLVADEGSTAVFSANDQMAVGLIRGLSELGRDVPGDISVVGFDDIPEAGYLRPPLTTIRQDFRALGVAAMGMLVDAIREPGPARAVAIEPTLVVRASTSSPRR